VPDGVTAPAMQRLLVTTDAVGGVWRYAVDLAGGLADRGIETVLAVLGPPADAAQRKEAEAVRGLRLVQTGLPLDWTADSLAALANASAKLAALASLTGVSAAHLHAPALVGGQPWSVPVVAVAHSCVGTWWRAVRGREMPADFRWRTEAAAAGLHAAAAVIAPTTAHAALLQEVYGPIPVQVVHNGRDPAPLPSSGPRSRAVFTAGRLWDEGKGVARLDQAATRLGAPVRAAGPVQGPDGGAATFANLDLLGTLDPAGMAAAYAGTSVFASMACYEPFGLAVLEAAQAGMALVLSDLPGFRELWDGAALFVGEGEDLPTALRHALDDPAPLAAAARQRGTRYTADAMTHATLAVHRAAALA
jgi:glycosyltransferase involved in cell wall biosynthesis